MRQLLAATLLALAPLTLAGAPRQAPAPDARERLVVSSAWLAQHVNDADLVLLHVGAKATYDAGHIANARFVTLRDLVADNAAPDALTLEMPAVDVLHDRLAALGISDRSRIVVYQSDDQWTPSTRVMLTLDYAGLANVSWLDGGQKAWTKSGQPLTTAPAPEQAGTLSPLKLKPTRVPPHGSLPGPVTSPRSVMTCS